MGRKKLNLTEEKRQIKICLGVLPYLPTLSRKIPLRHRSDVIVFSSNFQKHPHGRQHVPLRHEGTLHSRQTASSLVKLVEGEERDEAPDRLYSALP
ncbi:hypothetical protein TNCV_2669051 [Trichonephila clavipes]|nr:hypothetical protein TNCV_2669051 [Trichonephila clavipes]